jgi:hypothetical protein
VLGELPQLVPALPMRPQRRVCRIENERRRESTGNALDRRAVAPGASSFSKASQTRSLSCGGAPLLPSSRIGKGLPRGLALSSPLCLSRSTRTSHVVKSVASRARDTRFPIAMDPLSFRAGLPGSIRGFHVRRGYPSWQTGGGRKAPPCSPAYPVDRTRPSKASRLYSPSRGPTGTRPGSPSVNAGSQKPGGAAPSPVGRRNPCTTPLSRWCCRSSGQPSTLRPRSLSEIDLYGTNAASSSSCPMYCCFPGTKRPITSSPTRRDPCTRTVSNCPRSGSGGNST